MPGVTERRDPRGIPIRDEATRAIIGFLRMAVPRYETAEGGYTQDLTLLYMEAPDFREPNAGIPNPERIILPWDEERWCFWTSDRRVLHCDAVLAADDPEATRLRTGEP